jgi:hypothetical protein
MQSTNLCGLTSRWQKLPEKSSKPAALKKNKTEQNKEKKKKNP